LFWKTCSSPFDYSVDITTTRIKLCSSVGMSLLKLCLRNKTIDFVVISNCSLVWQWIYDLYYFLRLQPSSGSLTIYHYWTVWSFLNGKLTPVLFSGIIDGFSGGNVTNGWSWAVFEKLTLAQKHISHLTAWQVRSTACVYWPSESCCPACYVTLCRVIIHAAVRLFLTGF